MRERGIMSEFVQGKKTVFVAEDPERVLSYFKGRIGKLEEDLKQLHERLPEIRLMSPGGSRPTVRFYEGEETMFALFHEISRCAPKQVNIISNLKHVYASLSEKEIRTAQEALKSAKASVRILSVGDVVDMSSWIEYVPIISDMKPFDGDIWIFANRIVFVSYVGHKSGVIIESETFGYLGQYLFENAWRILKLQEGSVQKTGGMIQ
jgi:sugar-specific transcriptional regulator TrmB